MGCLCNESQTDKLSEINFMDSNGKNHEYVSNHLDISSQRSSLSGRNESENIQHHLNQNINFSSDLQQREFTFGQSSEHRSVYSHNSEVSEVLSSERAIEEIDHNEQEEGNDRTVNLMTLFEIYSILRGNSGPISTEDFIDFIRMFLILGGIPEETGLSVEQIEKIKTIRANNSDLGCPICQENVLRGEILLVLDCNHSFHKNCLSEWLERNKKCPMCRAIVNVPN